MEVLCGSRFTVALLLLSLGGSVTAYGQILNPPAPCDPPGVDSDGDGIPDCAVGVRVIPVSASGLHAINENEIILPAGGQTVTFEMFASNWSPNGDRLRNYDVYLDSRTFIGGDAGTVGFRRTYYPCVDNSQCLDHGFTCHEGLCWSGSGEPAGLIDPIRLDWIFVGYDTQRFTTSYAGLLIFNVALVEGNDSFSYVPPPRYIGTFFANVSEDAAGTFVVGIETSPNVTQFVQIDHLAPRLYVVGVPALITVRAPTCGNSQCELGEDDTNCPTDCLIEICGNGLCGPGENESNCPSDCLGAAIPALNSWGIAVLLLLLLVGARTVFRHTCRAT